MKLTIVLVFGLLFFSSCNEKPKGFDYDFNKTTYLYKYQYTYENEIKKSVVETTYYLDSGKIQDSTKIETELEYNDRGLLIREISNAEKDENSSYRLYNYNSEDSLKSQISISSSGDTVFWEEYEYYYGNRKPIYHRTILVYFDYKVNPEEEKYDTTFFTRKYEYEGDKLKKTIQFDVNGNISKIVEFLYEKDVLTNEKYYSVNGSEKELDKSKYYNYTKSKIHPDYYSLDSKNDTVEYCKMDFNKGKLVSNIEVSDYGDVYTKLYIDNGKEIGLEMFWYGMNQKAVDSYSYNENGDLKEIKSYEEEITHTNTQYSQ